MCCVLCVRVRMFVRACGGHGGFVDGQYVDGVKVLVIK